MKRILFILLATLSTAVCSAGTNAMSNSKVRKETRFLTDKMAYELNLSTEQYNDVYEINYDFISGVRYVMDDVLYGNEWALNRYYDYLDVRNDDLRWVLSSRQYARFMQAEYFYRPIYTSGNRWYFRVYITYTNHNHFYFPRPYHYRTYVGGHYRTHHNNVSYYRGRYKHPYYNGSYRIRDTKSYTTHRRSDFGSVTVRPGSDRAPSRDDVYTTRRSSSSSNRTTTPSTTRRESTNSGATTNTSSSSRRTNSSTKSSATDTNNSSRTNNSSSRNSGSSRTNSGSTRTNSSSETKSNTSSSRRSSSIQNKWDLSFSALCTDLSDRLDRSAHIGRMAYYNRIRLCFHLPQKIVHIHGSLCVCRNFLHNHPGLFQLVQRPHNRIVFHGADKHPVPRL